MLNQLISKIVTSQGVSDLMIKEGQPVWARKNGNLKRVPESEKNVSREELIEFLQKHENATGIHVKRISELLEVRGDLDFAIRIGELRYRGNLYWSNNKKLTIALRRLDEHPPKLSSLGVPHSLLSLITQSKGLILVTGATGSGKTTTLASVLEYLNQTREGHIITLEDPVEYVLESDKCLIDQRTIGRDAVSFKEGLRAALRQDPDILLVGELRDYDTVKTALDAANTGHLVLGTLHTNSAQQSIERLTSFFAEDEKNWAHAVLSQALLGIVSQVLVSKADKTGRLLAAEMLVCNLSDIRASIREARTSQIFNAMDTGSAKGHILLNNELKRMVKNGLITREEAIYASYDPVRLAKELN